MSSAPTVCRTHFPPVTKGWGVKRVDGRELSVTAALSDTGPDLVGDVIHLDGLDFGPHAKDPWVDLEHGRRADVGGLAVGWARDSLSLPGGRYSQFKAVVDGKELPFGKTYFDPDHRLQAQVFALCESGALPAVSLEFVPGKYKVIGKALIGDGEAREYYTAFVRRWTHCAVPVCEGAQVLADGVIRKSLAPPEPLLKILTDRRVRGHAGTPEPLAEVIYKALARHLPSKTTAPVGKGMDPYSNPSNPDPAPADTPAEPEPAAPDGPPTASAAYEAAQAIKDVIEATKDKLKASEHVAGKKKILKVLDKLETAACEELLAVGDQVTADVGDGDDAGEMTEDSDSPDVEDGATEADDERDGVMKAFADPKRAWALPAVLKARKYRMADLKPVESAKVEKSESHEETLEESIARIRREDPEGYRTKILPAMRERRRVNAWSD